MDRISELKINFKTEKSLDHRRERMENRKFYNENETEMITSWSGKEDTEDTTPAVMDVEEDLADISVVLELGAADVLN